MAILLVDETHTNDGDGDGWADQVGAGGARNLLDGALNSAAAGDDVYIRAGTSVAAVRNIVPNNGTVTNPVRLFGVKAATTNTTPVQSDLIPGLRTGDATRAYDQTGGDAAPVVSNSGANDFNLGGYLTVYGVKFTTADDMGFGGTTEVSSGDLYEECQFTFGPAHLFRLNASASVTNRTDFSNSNIVFTSGASARIRPDRARCRMQGVVFTFGAVKPTFMIGSNGVSGFFHLLGCDLSTLDTTIVDHSLIKEIDIKLLNCHLNSGVTISSGTVNSRFRGNVYGSEADGTAKGAGESRRQFVVETFNGTIENDVSFTRAGGASDRASGQFSRKMTPIVNGTRDNVLALEGPWERVWVEGDGSSKVLSVPIANSGAGDYQDDEVWLEALYPSEAGGAQHDFVTTQAPLLNPSNVLDDAASDWNGGGAGSNNAQTLQATIAPDYEGPLYWRVMFAKNFAASPESLHYDPRARLA